MSNRERLNSVLGNASTYRQKVKALKDHFDEYVAKDPIELRKFLKVWAFNPDQPLHNIVMLYLQDENAKYIYDHWTTTVEKGRSEIVNPDYFTLLFGESEATDCVSLLQTLGDEQSENIDDLTKEFSLELIEEYSRTSGNSNTSQFFKDFGEKTDFTVLQKRLTREQDIKEAQNVISALLAARYGSDQDQNIEFNYNKISFSFLENLQTTGNLRIINMRNSLDTLLQSKENENGRRDERVQSVSDGRSDLGHNGAEADLHRDLQDQRRAAGAASEQRDNARSDNSRESAVGRSDLSNPTTEEHTDQVNGISERGDELSDNSGVSRLEGDGEAAREEPAAGAEVREEDLGSHGADRDVETASVAQDVPDGDSVDLHAAEERGDQRGNGSLLSRIADKLEQYAQRSAIHGDASQADHRAGNSGDDQSRVRVSSGVEDGRSGRDYGDVRHADVLAERQDAAGLRTHSDADGEVPNELGRDLREDSELSGGRGDRSRNEREVSDVLSVQGAGLVESVRTLDGSVHVGDDGENAVQTDAADGMGGVQVQPVQTDALVSDVVTEEPSDRALGENVHLDEDSLAPDQSDFRVEKELWDGTKVPALSDDFFKAQINYNDSIDSTLRARRNVDALRLLRTLENENRFVLTDEEKIILSAYTGWGGVDPNLLYNERNKQGILDLGYTEREYRAMCDSLLTAYYTPTHLIDVIYQKLEEFGFKGGKILEPSCGVGKFFGRLPESMKNSELTGVELDSVSARIAKRLYPQANIKNTGFEKTSAENYYDVAIGNVPFGDFQVVDSTDPKISQNSIHNYFFLKALKEVRPNGVVAFITSAHTLSSKTERVRENMACKAKFLGAVHLPSTAFGASNTEAGTDIIFLQKREQELKPEEIDVSKPEFSWVAADLTSFTYEKETTEKGEKVTKTIPVPTSSYFTAHPEQVVGTIVKETNAYGWTTNCHRYDELVGNRCTEFTTRDVELVKSAMSNIHAAEHVFEQALDVKIKTNEADLNDDPIFKNTPTYSFYLDPDGQVMYKTLNSELPTPSSTKGFLSKIAVPKSFNAEKGTFTNYSTEEKLGILKDLIVIRDTFKDLKKLERSGASELDITAKQQVLSELYDKFVANYGKSVEFDTKFYDGVEHKPYMDYFIDRLGLEKDSSFYSLLSLENVDSDHEYLGKSNVFTEKVYDVEQEEQAVKSADDALIMSVRNKGKVDIEYIGSLLKSTQYNDIIEKLGKQIYRDPGKIKYDENNKIVPFSGFVTADEYLSGNIYQKIEAAQKFDKERHTSLFAEQIKDLEAVAPEKLEASDIYFDIGSRWIDVEYKNQFLRELIKNGKIRGKFIYNDVLDSYFFEADGAQSLRWETDLTTKYGIQDVNGKSLDAIDIYLKLLNYSSLKLTKSEIDSNGKTHHVADKEASVALSAKADLLSQEFNDWLFKDPERREKLVAKYNRYFNGIRPREYNGDLFTFKGMNKNITLRSHQKNAVARTLLGGNSLLAHEVGAGKTFEICASAMEKLRLGLAHKCAIVVPKPIISQFVADFYRLYPDAKIVTPTAKDFDKENRAKFLSRIAYGNDNIVILSKEQFANVPMSPEYRKQYYENTADKYFKAWKEEHAKHGDSPTAKQAIKKYNKLKSEVVKIEESFDKATENLTFEEMGIDALYVDEAHNYKNADVISSMDTIQVPQASGLARDMSMKCAYLNDLYDYSAVTFATGTPVSNSPLEFYTMQSYLNGKALKAANIHTADQFISTFGLFKRKAEMSVDASSFELKTRFAAFRNLPEAMRIFGECADIKTQQDLKDIISKPKAHFITVEAEPSLSQQMGIREIAQRANRVKRGSVKPTEDNMLKISLDGRKLGLDPRVLDPLGEDDPNSKVNKCVENVFKISQDDPKATQIIFCDLSTPKDQSVKEKKKEPTADENEFTIYADIKQKLLDKGMKPEEVCFIHDCKNDVQREQMLDDMRHGKIKVLLGSTAKLGTGVNVQDHLKAVHHLDVAWKPSDLEQRNGRIIRQGNRYKEVDIYTYISKGTFDAFMFQTLDRKSKFISQLMSNKHLDARKIDLDDDDDQTFDYATMMAVATGDERIKRKVELEDQLENYKLQKELYERNLNKITFRVNTELPQEISKQSALLAALQTDARKIESSLERLSDPKKFSLMLNNKVYIERAKAAEELMHKIATIDPSHGVVDVGEFCGFVMTMYKEKDIDKKTLKDTIKSYLGLRGTNGELYKVEMGHDGIGNLTRLSNLVKTLPERLNKAQDELEKLNQELVSDKETLDKQSEFENQAEYDRVKADYEQLMAELNGEKPSQQIQDQKSSIEDDFEDEEPNEDLKDEFEHLDEFIQEEFVESEPEESLCNFAYRNPEFDEGLYKELATRVQKIVKAFSNLDELKIAEFVVKDKLLNETPLFDERQRDKVIESVVTNAIKIHEIRANEDLNDQQRKWLCDLTVGNAVCAVNEIVGSYDAIKSDIEFKLVKPIFKMDVCEPKGEVENSYLLSVKKALTVYELPEEDYARIDKSLSAWGKLARHSVNKLRRNFENGSMTENEFEVEKYKELVNFLGAVQVDFELPRLKETMSSALEEASEKIHKENLNNEHIKPTFDKKEEQHHELSDKFDLKQPNIAEISNEKDKYAILREHFVGVVAQFAALSSQELEDYLHQDKMFDAPELEGNKRKMLLGVIRAVSDVQFEDRMNAKDPDLRHDDGKRKELFLKNRKKAEREVGELFDNLVNCYEDELSDGRSL